MSYRSRGRVLAATALTATALALTVPATVASAQACDVDQDCSHGKPRNPPGGGSPIITGSYKTGWVLYVDADGAGSYWRWSTYRVDALGHCFDSHGTGVGCPD